MFRLRNAVGPLLSTVLISAPALAVPISINVVDGPNEGFNDPLYGSVRLAPFADAARIWSGILEPSFAGEAITVDLATSSLTGYPPAAEAAGSPLNYHRVSNGSIAGFEPNTWYPAPLANHIIGRDLAPADSELQVAITDSLNDLTPISGPGAFDPSGNYTADVYAQFLAFGLHEIGHGLGFISLADPPASSSDAWQRFPLLPLGGSHVLDRALPSIFDRHVIDDLGRAITSLSRPEWESKRDSFDLFWGGPNGILANGGLPPSLDNSVSHFDYSVHGNSLMQGLPGGVLDMPSFPTALDLAVFKDLGWTISSDALAVPEPQIIGIFGIGLAGLGAVAWQRRRVT